MSLLFFSVLTVLTCFICQQDFHTARGVLQHIQYVHHMDMFLQKTPLPMDHIFTDALDKQVILATESAVPTNKYTTENSAVPGVATAVRPNVTTATTFTDNRSTVTHISDSLDVSPSKQSELPVTCAKLALAEGTTICCNGKECQVTINPPAKVPPPKKCCSSVVPKKRTRHMQEHDSEDMEQCALETLASFRGRFLLNQKSRSCQKKPTRRACRSSRKCKDKCVLRCERVVCVEKKSSVHKEEGEECSDEDGSHNEVCTSDDSEHKTETSQHKVEIYSIEKDGVTSRKTVIMNSGMTVTMEPTKVAALKDKEDQIPHVTHKAPAFASGSQNQNVLNLDTSRESAQILAELMFHKSPPLDQAVVLMPVSVQNLPTPAADTNAPLISPAETQVNQPLPGPAQSSLLPLSVAFSSSGSVSFGDTFGCADTNPNVPNPLDMDASVHVSKSLGQMTVSPPAEMHQLHELDALTTSMRFFDSLDPVSNDSSALVVSDIPLTPGSSACSVGQNEGSADEKDGRKVAAGKKRRYPTSRPYKCGECDQAFNQPIHLKKHMSKHTGSAACFNSCGNNEIYSGLEIPGIGSGPVNH